MNNKIKLFLILNHSGKVLSDFFSIANNDDCGDTKYMNEYLQTLYENAKGIKKELKKLVLMNDIEVSNHINEEFIGDKRLMKRVLKNIEVFIDEVVVPYFEIKDIDAFTEGLLRGVEEIEAFAPYSLRGDFGDNYNEFQYQQSDFLKGIGLDEEILYKEFEVTVNDKDVSIYFIGDLFCEYFDFGFMLSSILTYKK